MICRLTERFGSANKRGETLRLFRQALLLARGFWYDILLSISGQSNGELEPKAESEKFNPPYISIPSANIWWGRGAIPTGNGLYILHAETGGFQPEKAIFLENALPPRANFTVFFAKTARRM